MEATELQAAPRHKVLSGTPRVRTMRGAESRTMTDPTKTAPALSPGDVIGGKYRVEAEIGSGGMGVVLSVKHLAMGHRLAIKVLRLEDKSEEQGAVARFVREARAAARIESDHVVRVTDVAALPDGTPYMVMEYLEGEDLRELLRRRRQLPIDEAVGYVLQACEGLAEAHAAGVIHRDLKPSNLFLALKPNRTTVLKVLDFGISKVVPRQGEVAITTTSSLMGSPLYMAPEQMRSSKDVDVRADIWSLGVILYELLAGVAPFEGESVPEVCVSVMGGEPIPIPRFRDDIPNELQAILLRCLQKERTERYASMGALARALEPFGRERQRVHAERASAAVRSARSVMVSEPDEEYGRAPPPLRREPDSVPSWSAGRTRPRRSKKVWLAIGGVSCLVAAGLGATLGRANRSAGLAEHAVPTANASSVSPTVTVSLPPVTTTNLPSVPFESLPVASHDAGTSRPIASPRKPAPLLPAIPAPASSSSAAKKDGWQWGD